MLGRNNAVIKIITLAGVGKINPRERDDKLFVAAYTDNNNIMHIIHRVILLLLSSS